MNKLFSLVVLGVMIAVPLSSGMAKGSKGRRPAMSDQQFIAWGNEACRKKYPGQIVYAMVDAKKRRVTCWIR
jgi:hypothetical protein